VLQSNYGPTNHMVIFNKRRLIRQTETSSFRRCEKARCPRRRVLWLFYYPIARPDHWIYALYWPPSARMLKYPETAMQSHQRPRNDAFYPANAKIIIATRAQDAHRVKVCPNVAHPLHAARRGWTLIPQQHFKM